MNYVNREPVAVNIYRYDDNNAPTKDKVSNNMATIIKACLVTGYGNKPSAGWSLEYEDNDRGIKVLRPPQSAEQDFYLRLSEDDGTSLKAEVLFNMTDIDNGDLKLAYEYPFKYALTTNNNRHDRWLIVANSRGFWIFTEKSSATYSDVERSGTFFFCGDTGKNDKGYKALFLDYSGGSDKRSHYELVSNTLSVTYRLQVKIYDVSKDKVFDVDSYISLFKKKSGNDFTAVLDNNLLLAPIYIVADNELYPIVGVFLKSNGAVEKNFTEISNGYLAMSDYSDGNQQYKNLAINTIEWVY